MASKHNRSRKPKNNASVGPKLAYELFSELNATFYQDDPSEYLLVKIEAVTLMLAPAEALAPAYASERAIGVARHAGMPVPSKQTRDRYVRTECVLVLHHACETLLRLFFAHADKQDCPWLGMAASVSFVEFKEKVSAALRSGFDPDTVARVFLGGPDPDDAALGVEADEFDETVSAWQFLLEFAAETVLSESFLYNSAKHGLTIVHTDESTQLAFTPPGGGDPVHLLVGSQFAYLHRPENPGAKGGTEWWVSLTHTLPDQDIEVALLIQRAVSSLWNVARRRYTGQAGEVWILTVRGVRDAVYAPVAEKGPHVRTHTHELVKKDAGGELNGVDMRMTGPGLPDESEWTRKPSTTVRHHVRLLFLCGNRTRESSARPAASCCRSRRTGHRGCDRPATAGRENTAPGVESGYLRADVDTQAVADAMTGIAIPTMRRVLRGELDVGGRDAVARTIAQLVTRGIAAS